MSAAGSSGERPPSIRRAAMPCELTYAHVDDQRAGKGRQRLPVERGLGLVGVLVAGEEGDRTGRIAMGHRYTRVGRCGDARSDPGHHLEGDVGIDQRLGLLAAAPEHERVTALEPHDDLRGAAMLDQQPRDLSLRHLLAAALLAGVDQLRVQPCAVQRSVRDQPVVDDHVGAGRSAPASERSSGPDPPGRLRRDRRSCACHLLCLLQQLACSGR